MASSVAKLQFQLKTNSQFASAKKNVTKHSSRSVVTCSSKSDNAERKQPSLIDTNRRQMLMGTAATFGACACNTCGTGPAMAFSYGDLAGPPAWTELCKEGISQSPINIDTNAAILNPAAQSYFKFDYPKNPKAFVNSGHGVKVSYEPGSYATIGKRRLELLQFHFHTPSEHTVDGKHAQMEVHMVHKDVDSGLLCVLGSMMIAKKGSPAHPGLQTAMDNMPNEPNAERIVPCSEIDVTSFVSPGSGFWNYSGSLTTPPCSESVNWFVFSEPIYCAPEQVLQYQEQLGEGRSLSLNNRPPNEINARNVSYYSFSNRGAARF